MCATPSRACIDCESFYPAEPPPTEFGICLEDEAFEPYIDELLRDDYSRCQALVRQKRFRCDREACEHFSEAKVVEIDDDSSLGHLLQDARQGRPVDRERMEQAYFSWRIENMDWKTLPVGEHVEKLNGDDDKARESALATLAYYAGEGNEAALAGLLDYLRGIPAPRTIDEVHFKCRVLDRLSHLRESEELFQLLVADVLRTEPSRTTRQWIRDVIDHIGRHRSEKATEALRSLRESGHLSHRWNRHFKKFLEGWDR